MSAVDIRDLPLSPEGDRVVTKHLPENAEVVLRYARPVEGLSDEDKFRQASFAKKMLNHLGYDQPSLGDFVNSLRNGEVDEDEDF